MSHRLIGHDIIDLTLVHLGISQSLLHGLQSRSEQIGVELLKASTGDGCVEVFIKKGVNLDMGLHAGGKSTLCLLAGFPEATHSAFVSTRIFLVFILKLLNKVVNHAVDKVLTSQVSVSGRRHNLENAVFNFQDGDIEASTSQVKYKDVMFSLLSTRHGSLLNTEICKPEESPPSNHNVAFVILPWPLNQRLSGISNETACFCEGNITWSCTVSLVIGNNFDLSLL
ncbi:hypothetical protein B566_EDAN017945 [Ephemera danica]|nr:hypothetical protein B566_EDAN017945 [Ephemera danica]